MFPYIGNVSIPIDSYFSEGLKPPTRKSCLSFGNFFGTPWFDWHTDQLILAVPGTADSGQTIALQMILMENHRKISLFHLISTVLLLLLFRPIFIIHLIMIGSHGDGSCSRSGESILMIWPFLKLSIHQLLGGSEKHWHRDYLSLLILLCIYIYIYICILIYIGIVSLRALWFLVRSTTVEHERY